MSDTPKSREFDLLKPASEKNPFLKFMGIELLDAGAGWARMKMSFREDLLQPFTMHGGAIYSLADSAAAHAAMTHVVPDQYVTTVEQRINFLKAVRDQDIFADAQVVNLGRTLVYVEVTLHSAEGKLIGRSAATLMRLDRDRIVK
ncbi:MAG: PaaI family thioesterase [Blastocatellales bacterium]